MLKEFNLTARERVPVFVIKLNKIKLNLKNSRHPICYQDDMYIIYLVWYEIAGLAGEKTALSLIHLTRDWWMFRCWERTNSYTLRRDAARGRAYELRRGSPRWRPWGPTRRTPRKVRNTLTTHSTEWAVRVFHSLTKQATCYSMPCSNRASDSLLSLSRFFQWAASWKSMNSEDSLN